MSFISEILCAKGIFALFSGLSFLLCKKKKKNTKENIKSLRALQVQFADP
jgi:hypothetical protein